MNSIKLEFGNEKHIKYARLAALYNEGKTIKSETCFECKGRVEVCPHCGAKESEEISELFEPVDGNYSVFLCSQCNKKCVEQFAWWEFKKLEHEIQESQSINH